MNMWTVEVDLALHRPPAVHRTSRVTLMADSAMDAELTAIHMAEGIHNAVMAVGSRVINWPDD